MRAPSGGFHAQGAAKIVGAKSLTQKMKEKVVFTQKCGGERRALTPFPINFFADRYGKNWY